MACKLFDTCDKAYRDSPGHYCQDWVKGGIEVPCCCKAGDYCVVSNTTCLCHKVVSPRDNTIKLIYIGVVSLLICIYLICIHCKTKTLCGRYMKRDGTYHTDSGGNHYDYKDTTSITSVTSNDTYPRR